MQKSDTKTKKGMGKGEAFEWEQRPYEPEDERDARERREEMDRAFERMRLKEGEELKAKAAKAAQDAIDAAVWKETLELASMARTPTDMVSVFFDLDSTEFLTLDKYKHFLFKNPIALCALKPSDRNFEDIITSAIKDMMVMTTEHVDFTTASGVESEEPWVLALGKYSDSELEAIVADMVKQATETAHTSWSVILKCPVPPLVPLIEMTIQPPDYSRKQVKCYPLRVRVASPVHADALKNLLTAHNTPFLSRPPPKHERRWNSVMVASTKGPHYCEPWTAGTPFTSTMIQSPEARMSFVIGGGGSNIATFNDEHETQFGVIANPSQPHVPYGFQTFCKHITKKQSQALVAYIDRSVQDPYKDYEDYNDI
jgi:hypothetical protein